MFSRFPGSDSGDLTDVAMDEMDRLLDASVPPVTWLLDLRNAANVAVSVSRTWTEWLKVRHARIRRIDVLAASPLFPLVLTVAAGTASTSQLVNVYRNVPDFRVARSETAPDLMREFA